MTDLYIHIGSSKTGTTAIQHFLTEHRERLAAEGVLYPMGGIFRTAHHLIGAAIYPGRASRLGIISRDETLETAIIEIKAEIAELKPHTVILSTEYLWGELSTANIRRLLDPFRDLRIRIVAYLRRQDLLAQSLYVQAVKGGYAQPFREWLSIAQEGTKGGFHLDAVLSGWRDNGVPIEIIARVYEKGQIDEDIIADFMKTVCPQVQIERKPESPSVNTAPDITTVELLRVVSTCLGDKDMANWARRRIIAHSPHRVRFAPLTFLPAPEVAEFMKRFSEGNERVAREFLGRADGVLFRQPLPAGGEEAPAPTDDSALLRHLIRMLPELMAPKGSPRRPSRHPPPQLAAASVALGKNAKKKAKAVGASC